MLVSSSYIMCIHAFQDNFNRKMKREFESWDPEDYCPGATLWKNQVLQPTQINMCEVIQGWVQYFINGGGGTKMAKTLAGILHDRLLGKHFK